MQIDQCIRPSTLNEAAQLLSEPGSLVLGGGAWTRLTSKKVPLALELSRLGLDSIDEKENEITLGAMTTLRQIETSALLKDLFGGIIPGAVEHIVGVQMRNIITLGGNLFGRYGFSDLITALLVLPAEVLVFGEDPVPLKEWILRKPSEKVLVTGLRLRKDKTRAAYQGIRISKTDFSILNAAASCSPEGEYTIAVGARPAAARLCPRAAALLKGKSQIAEDDLKAAAEKAAEEVSFKSDIRGSGEYRRKVAPVLVRRALQEVTR